MSTKRPTPSLRDLDSKRTRLFLPDASDSERFAELWRLADALRSSSKRALLSRSDWACIPSALIEFSSTMSRRPRGAPKTPPDMSWRYVMLLSLWNVVAPPSRKQLRSRRKQLVAGLVGCRVPPRTLEQTKLEQRREQEVHAMPDERRKLLYQRLCKELGGNATAKLQLLFTFPREN